MSIPEASGCASAWPLVLRTAGPAGSVRVMAGQQPKAIYRRKAALHCAGCSGPGRWPANRRRPTGLTTHARSHRRSPRRDDGGCGLLAAESCPICVRAWQRHDAGRRHAHFGAAAGGAAWRLPGGAFALLAASPLAAAVVCSGSATAPQRAGAVLVQALAHPGWPMAGLVKAGPRGRARARTVLWRADALALVLICCRGRLRDRMGAGNDRTPGSLTGQCEGGGPGGGPIHGARCGRPRAAAALGASRRRSDVHSGANSRNAGRASSRTRASLFEDASRRVRGSSARRMRSRLRCQQSPPATGVEGGGALRSDTARSGTPARAREACTSCGRPARVRQRSRCAHGAGSAWGVAAGLRC